MSRWTIAPRRQVRKIAGAGPGMVTYRGERTLRVEPVSLEELTRQGIAARAGRVEVMKNGAPRGMVFLSNPLRQGHGTRARRIAPRVPPQ